MVPCPGTRAHGTRPHSGCGAEDHGQLRRRSPRPQLKVTCPSSSFSRCETRGDLPFLLCLNTAAQGHGAETESPAARGGPCRERGGPPWHPADSPPRCPALPSASLLLPPGLGQAQAWCGGVKGCPLELNRTPPAQRGPRLRRALTQTSRRESEFLRTHPLDFAGQQELRDVPARVCTPVLGTPMGTCPLGATCRCVHMHTPSTDGGRRAGTAQPWGPHLGTLPEPQGVPHPSRRLLKARAGLVSLATANSEAASGWTAGVALHSLLASQGGPAGQQGPAPGFKLWSSQW